MLHHCELRVGDPVDPLPDMTSINQLVEKMLIVAALFLDKRVRRHVVFFLLLHLSLALIRNSRLDLLGHLALLSRVI